MPTTKALSASKFFGKDRYEYYLNELLTQQKVGGNALSKSQIKEGFLKRKDKISFEKFVEKVISTKTIVAPTKKSTSSGGGVGLGSRGGGLVKSPTGALEKYVSGVSKPQKMSGIEDDISKITKSVISIAEILSGQKKLKDSSTSYDRRKAEQEKRSLAESKLEKRFDGLKKAAEKILAPVKSLLDKIINFLVTVFLGRVVYKLLEWFGDPKNADKVKSIGRFLGDHWPKLLALYLTFGTSFGRFALGLTKAVASGAIKLAFAIAKLLAAKKVKGAMGAARFLGGKGGKIAGAVLGTVAAVGGAYALTQGMKGDGEEPETSKSEKPKTPGYSGGGSVKIPKFAGGGLNVKGMLGGAGMGAMFGPMGMLLGGVLGSGKPQEMANGFVSGEKGVDKVPAMLSDGEFVMSVGAVQKYGVDTLEGMNAAGGGTNKPKMMGGKTYAASGGMMGDQKENVRDRILEKREKEQKSGSSSKSTTPKSTTPKQTLPTLSPIELKFASRAKQRGITDPIELKAFLAQVKHESGGNFGDPQREKYNSSPNDPPGKPGYEYFKPYANPALGLGNRNADDAYKYIGRGYLQVTGKANYEDIGKRIGKDLIRNPTLLMNKDVALDASIEYWKRSVRPNVKNWNNTFEVSRAVNKPAAVSPDEITGMSDREDIFKGYSSISNKIFTDLKTDTEVKPTIKKEPSLIDRLGSIFSPRPAMAGEPNAKQKSSPKPKPMDKGGFLDVLGKILPNTGTVMAPRTSGPKDVRGNQQTEPAYQNKLLGIPLGSPSSKFSEGGFRGMRAPLGPGGDVGGYTKEQKKRYASRTGSSFVPTSYAGSISGAMGDSHLRFPGLPSLQNKKIEIPDYMMLSTPVSKSQQQTRQPSSPITLQNNQNLNLAIQNARDVTNMPGGAVYRPLVESAINSSIKTQTRYDTLRNVMRQTGTSGADENMNMRGNIIKKQGGGLFGGTKTPSTPPVKGFTGKYDMHGNPTGYGVRGGGIIKENTGIDIPGGGADRQNVRVQPGEYIIPKKVVDTVGVNLLDKRVANIDKNSNPYKLGADRQIEPQSPPISRLNPAQIQTKNNIPRITPTPRPAPKIVSAPSVAGGGMGGRRGSGAKAMIPQFNAYKNNSKTAKQLGVK